MRVTIFDYGAGNMHSLEKAIGLAGGSVRLEADPVAATDTDVLVLPGVGAFGAAAHRLAPGREAMRIALEGGLPCLGICLGMQLLFDDSEEDEAGTRGLGIIAGRVRRLRSRRVPQIGWNSLEAAADPLLADTALQHVYYANSFVCEPSDASVVRAWTEHEGDRFAAVVRQGAMLGVQFHPEKSSTPGVHFLRSFLDSVRT